MSASEPGRSRRRRRRGRARAAPRRGGSRRSAAEGRAGQGGARRRRGRSAKAKAAGTAAEPARADPAPSPPIADRRSPTQESAAKRLIAESPDRASALAGRRRSRDPPARSTPTRSRAIVKGYTFEAATLDLGALVNGDPVADGADPHPARHDEPPRARRRRHRHRQDPHAAGARRAARGEGRAGVRRRHQGRPLGRRDAG